MKIPLRHLPLAVLALSLSLACTNPNSNKPSDSSGENLPVAPADDREVDCSTIGNFVVPARYAQDWINRFKTIYRQDGSSSPRTDLETSYWIDACIISGFKKFFDQNRDYDGARFHMMYMNGTTKIVLVPTRPSPRFFKHKNIWDVDVPLSCGSNQEFRYVNRRLSDVQPHRDNFDLRFRTGPTGIDSLSSGVWFSRCLFDSLDKYLSDVANGLDGVRVHLGAYDRRYSGTYQKAEQQSTFVLVVTKPNGQNHEDDWDLLSEKFKGDNKFLAAAYNHGELCPKNCPLEDDEP